MDSSPPPESDASETLLSQDGLAGGPLDPAPASSCRILKVGRLALLALIVAGLLALASRHTMPASDIGVASKALPMEAPPDPAEEQAEFEVPDDFDDEGEGEDAAVDGSEDSSGLDEEDELLDPDQKDAFENKHSSEKMKTLPLPAGITETQAKFAVPVDFDDEGEGEDAKDGSEDSSGFDEGGELLDPDQKKAFENKNFKPRLRMKKHGYNPHGGRIELWPNGVVPYYFDSSITAEARQVFEEAIKEWEGKTCIKFQNKAHDTSYEHISKGCVNGHNIVKHTGKSLAQCEHICDGMPNCAAFEFGVSHGGSGGYQPGDCQPQSSASYAGCDGGRHNVDLYIKKETSNTGPGTLRLQSSGTGCNCHVGYSSRYERICNLEPPGCIYKKVAMHELGHAVGLRHEHQRHSAKEFVDLKPKPGVSDSWKRQFTEFDDDGDVSADVPYDMASIMHYGTSAHGTVTFKKKDIFGNCKFGYKGWLSEGDIVTINRWYGCPNHFCADLSKHCKAWKGRGYCTKEKENFVSFMKANCAHSCGECECKDKDNNEKCPKWAKEGYCRRSNADVGSEINKNYMHIHCRRSCGDCLMEDINTCKDQAIWGKSDGCSKHKDDTREGQPWCKNAWFISKCPKSCNLCPHHKYCW